MTQPRCASWVELTTGQGCGQHRYTELFDSQQDRRGRWRIAIVALGMAFSVAVGWVTGMILPTASMATLGLPTALSEERQTRDSYEKATMSVRVSNDYTVGQRGADLVLYPWEHLAEPYRKTAMRVKDWPKEDVAFDMINFRWAVRGEVVGTGESLETVFYHPGMYQCTVTAFYSEEDREAGTSGIAGAPSETSSVDLYMHTFDVMVKYVRREIRDLTDRDRETFFNAVSVLQRVPSAVGRQIYGEKYYSKDYFNRIHLYYGGQKDCDHWHDGAGFVTSHIAISLMFEQALQAVNPSIALPYWDFTVEGMAYDWTNFRESEVFSDDWFGDAAPRNELMTPKRGRFGYVPVMPNATEYSALHNSYGLLRSPWNSDPNPFLTRHDHVFGYSNNRKPAGCRQYKDAVEQSTWMSLTQSMNAGAHGHIHELLGGAWSSDWDGFYQRTGDIILPFTHMIVPFMKYLWRSGYIECPEWCAPNDLWRDCQCVPNAEAMSGKRPSEVLESSGLLAPKVGAFFFDKDLKLVDDLSNEEGHAHSIIPGYTAEETNDIYTEMLRVLITPMKVGTHYEGTSTNDITFWVLHPTFDRLWHLSRMQGVPDFDETWLDDHDCYGHNPTDIQPFHDLFLHGGELDEDSAEGYGGGQQASLAAGPKVGDLKAYLTNEMLYELFRPDALALPYVYDHFEWQHCDALGIFMHGFLT